MTGLGSSQRVVDPEGQWNNVPRHGVDLAGVELGLGAILLHIDARYYGAHRRGGAALVRELKGELTGAILGAVERRTDGGNEVAEGVTTIAGGLAWASEGGGDVRSSDDDVGDVGSGSLEASSTLGRAEAPSSSWRAVAAHGFGAAAAGLGGGEDGLSWLAGRGCPERTRRSTNDGRALSRGRNPSCIQNQFRAPGATVQVCI